MADWSQKVECKTKNIQNTFPHHLNFFLEVIYVCILYEDSIRYFNDFVFRTNFKYEKNRQKLHTHKSESHVGCFQNRFNFEKKRLLS